MRRSRRASPHDDEGFIGGIEGLVFGLLIFVVGGLLIAHAWALVETKSAVTAAASDAARAYVKAPIATSGQTSQLEQQEASAAYQAALTSASSALNGFGRSPSAATVKIPSQSFTRCESVTVTVSFPAPMFELPLFGKVGSGGQISASSTQLIDAYRSGITGAVGGSCG